jgi:RHS repeat-associated protein
MMQVVDYDHVLSYRSEPLQGLQYSDDCVASIDNADDVTTYHRDRQFNTIGLTDSTGAVLNLASYTPYGDFTVTDASGTTVDVSTVDNEYWYTGRRLDKESELWYFRARYFDSEMGTFISRDPLGYVDGMTIYAGYFSAGLGVDPFGQTWNDKWLAKYYQKLLNALTKNVIRRYFYHYPGSIVHKVIPGEIPVVQVKPCPKERPLLRHVKTVVEEHYKKVKIFLRQDGKTNKPVAFHGTWMIIDKANGTGDSPHY